MYKIRSEHREISFDFLYTHGNDPRKFTVEVDAVVKSPDPFDDTSDMDNQGYQIVTGYRVYQKQTIGYSEVTMEFSGFDIPEDVLYSELSAYLRDEELDSCFEEETGGC